MVVIVIVVLYHNTICPDLMPKIICISVETTKIKFHGVYFTFLYSSQKNIDIEIENTLVL